LHSSANNCTEKPGCSQRDVLPSSCRQPGCWPKGALVGQDLGQAKGPVLPSACLALGAPAGAKRAGGWPDRLATALRGLPVPVIGRIEDGLVKLDVRCLDGAQAEAAFLSQLPLLAQARF
jgi:hypothetical protein